MPAQSKDVSHNYYQIPKWFPPVITALGGIIMTILLAAWPWANRVEKNVATIQAELKATNKLNRVYIDNLTKEVERHEIIIENLRTELRANIK